MKSTIMPEAGQTLPAHFIIKATGETVTIVKSARDTKGEYSEFIVTLPAGAPGAPLHIHPLQSEYFEVISGRLGLLVDHQKIELEPGETITVPKATHHTFYNAGDTEMKWKVKVMPALNFEYLAEEMIAASNRNYPRPASSWEWAYILSQANGEYYLAGVSMLRQRVIQPLQAKIGRLLGYSRHVQSLKNYRASRRS